MPFISDLLENHLVVLGSTDSGKSTFAEYLFMNTPHKTIYYDQQDERTKGFLLDKTFTISDLKRHNKILIYAKFRHEDKEHELSGIINNLKLIGSHLPPRKIWCVLFVDEAHEVAPKSDRNSSLNFLFTKGKRYGLTGVAISQRPSLLSHTVLTQAKNTVIYRLSDMEFPYFREYHIDIEAHKEHLNKDYHFILKNHKGEMIKYNPIKIYKKKERKQNE